MIEAFRKRRELAVDIFRRDPYRLLAVPAAGHHVFRKTRHQIGDQFRALKREGMIGARNDDERCTRSESCSGRGVRKSNSPLKIMVGTWIAANFGVSGLKLRKDSIRLCKA